MSPDAAPVTVKRPRGRHNTIVDRGTFAANLSLMLRRRRMFPHELAALLRMDNRRVARLASGHNAPHYSEIPDFARALDVRPEWLAWMAPAEFALATRPA